MDLCSTVSWPKQLVIKKSEQINRNMFFTSYSVLAQYNASEINIKNKIEIGEQ